MSERKHLLEVNDLTVSFFTYAGEVQGPARDSGHCGRERLWQKRDDPDGNGSSAVPARPGDAGQRNL